MGGHEEIWYATNMESFDYVNAYRSLLFSADNAIVYSPTQLAVSFDVDDKLYTVRPGETLTLT